MDTAGTSKYFIDINIDVDIDTNADSYANINGGDVDDTEVNDGIEGTLNA